MIPANPLEPASDSAASANACSSAYQDQLHPWCIIRHLPKLQRITVARFRRRNDAESHLKVLQHMTPQYRYTIIFEITPDPIPELAHQSMPSSEWLNWH